MSKKAAVTLLIFCAGGLAAYSGWQVGDELLLRNASAALANPPLPPVDDFPKSNRDAKSDRDFVASRRSEVSAPLAVAYAPEETGSIPVVADTNPVVTDPKPVTFENARAEISPPPAPAPKPKAVAKIEKMGRALLNDFQIAGIKQRLSLNATQERYWPAVEKALRGLSERVVDYQKRRNRSRDDSADTEAAEIRQLKSAARPFLAQLRDDQKSEVIMLANMAGLGPVVTEIASGRDLARNDN